MGMPPLRWKIPNAKPPADPKKGLIEKIDPFSQFPCFVCRLGLSGDFLLGFGWGPLGRGRGLGSLQMPLTSLKMPLTFLKTLIYGGFYVFKGLSFF